MDILAFIETSDFFEGASEKSKRLLAEICIPRQIVKKDVLFNQGEKAFAFYLLASGAVGIYKGRPDGREVVIKVIQPGEIFAEVVLFEESAYPATAIVLKSGTVFTIPKHQFYCLLDNKEFRIDFIALLMRKQRYLAERIRYLTIHDVEERFFSFLQEHYGNRKKITIALSNKDIAAAIGATPETYSRLIARLVQEKKIVFQGKAIMVLPQNQQI